jgi:hypothetical protein
MKMQRILIGGVVVMVFNSVLMALTCGWLFKWVYTLEPTNVWKPMDNMPGAAYFLGAVVMSIIFAFVYALLQKGIPGKNQFLRGIVFGLCTWAVGMLPGMLALYFCMTINPTVPIYWTILGLVQLPLNGLIVAAIYGE